MTIITTPIRPCVYTLVVKLIFSPLPFVLASVWPLINSKSIDLVVADAGHHAAQVGERPQLHVVRRHADPLQLAFTVASVLNLDVEKEQSLLETPTRLEGLRMVLGWVALTLGLRRWFDRHPQDIDESAKGWRGHLSRLRHALMEPAHHRPAAWLLTLANWALKLAAGASLLSAITDANFIHAWAGALGGELAAIVPLQGPAGFGTYEAGVWVGMASGLPAGIQGAANAAAGPLTQAISAALALHLCFLLCAVLAGLVALWLSRLAPPAADASPRASA